MFYAEKIALIVGLCLVLYAYFRYWRRTVSFLLLFCFWRRSMALNVVDFKLQRDGISLFLVAVVLLFFQALL